MRGYIRGIITGKSKGVFPSFVGVILLILSFFYGLAVSLLAFKRRASAKKLGCLVISVGNITAGGTGKTALIEYLAAYLSSRGHNIAVLSRGYKRPRPARAIERTSFGMMGDEPYMLSRNLIGLKVIVDPDRVRAAKKAVGEFCADTVLLDDGFQQWHIKKDLEIVTIDCTDPFSNGQVLPRGLLREPLSALKRADVFVLTKTDLGIGSSDISLRLTKINPSALIVASVHAPLGFYPIEDISDIRDARVFKDKPAASLCGIADPDSFEETLRRLGVKLELSFRFPDHHNFTHRELAGISDKCRSKAVKLLLTTQKDAARIDAGALPPGLDVFVLRIGIKVIKNEEEFRSRLSGLYRS